MGVFRLVLFWFFGWLVGLVGFGFFLFVFVLGVLGVLGVLWGCVEVFCLVFFRLI